MSEPVAKKTTKEWKIYAVSNGNLHFDFQTGNGNFVQKGFLNQAANVNDIDFTGQHRSKFEGVFTSELVGLIVESTGAYLELDGRVERLVATTAATFREIGTWRVAPGGRVLSTPGNNTCPKSRFRSERPGLHRSGKRVFFSNRGSRSLGC